jgi:hypothetical protein
LFCAGWQVNERAGLERKMPVAQFGIKRLRNDPRMTAEQRKKPEQSFMHARTIQFEHAAASRKTGVTERNGQTGS